METINIVGNLRDVERVYLFLISENAFDLEMNEFRLSARKEAVYGSLEKKHCKYWYAQDSGSNIVAAIGIAENERENGGYYLDYFAVHKDHRRKGLGSKLLKVAEDFVKSQKGRFILIDTGDTPLFEPARKFYEKNGYTAVSHIPEYYEKGDGRIDYFKKLD